MRMLGRSEKDGREGDVGDVEGNPNPSAPETQKKERKNKKKFVLLWATASMKNIKEGKQRRKKMSTPSASRFASKTDRLS
jgi:hypothetical protein